MRELKAMLMTRAVTFTQAQVRRAVKAAESAGLQVRSGRSQPTDCNRQSRIDCSKHKAADIHSCRHEWIECRTVDN